MSTTVFTFIGGIGLLLLGMRLMSDGLKLAAGNSIRSILAAATRSRLRGLASGVLITSIVQSSSAVIFATVGFVNAGLLKLSQAIGIIYGINLGTTATSWIVALLGFNVNIQAIAMPAIGIGMGLWIGFGDRRRGAIGQALTGVGLFFLAIDVLRATFADMGDVAALVGWAGQGIPGLLLFVGVGIVLTVLMQSSSASLAVTLTAAAGGLIPLPAAAAIVIGANIGTTSTAAFAVIGATAPARRAASAHVLFNVITGVFALLLLPALLWLSARISVTAGLVAQPAVSLAIFHTLTKVVGIAIMWPLTGRLVGFLESRFRREEEDEGRPHYLDHNVQSAPALALDALAMELHRMSALARRMAGEAFSAEDGDARRLDATRKVLDRLNLAVGEFASGVSRHGGAVAELAESLPDALRISQYLVNAGEYAVEMARLQKGMEPVGTDLAATRHQLLARAVRLLDHARVEAPDWDAAMLQEQRMEFESAYQDFKRQLLRAGTTGDLSPRHMVALLDQLSALHRVMDQLGKAALYLDRFIRHNGDLPEPGSADMTAT